MTQKEKYRKLCIEDNQIPIFSQDWWLDADCGENNWDAIIVEKDNKIIGAMPYRIHKRYFFKYIIRPIVGEGIQIYINHPEKQKYTNKLSFEKEVISEIINKIPEFSMFDINFNPEFNYALPFYWNGFFLETKFTYIIEDLNNEENIFNSFKENIKTDIRKAQKSLLIEISDNINDFYKLYSLTFIRQNIKPQISFEKFSRIHAECAKRGYQKIFIAKDRDNKIHAAIYIVWDSNYAYYLLGGADPELRQSGAHSLLLWNAIRFSSTVTKKFDFGGSMIESIERFFRGFGGVLKPYLNVKKINSKILKIRDFIFNY